MRVFAWLLMAALSVQAQTQTRTAEVFRCGHDGLDLRDSPCPSGPGASSTLHYDQPSEADRRAARERHRTDARLAAELARDRRAAEAQARRDKGTRLHSRPTPPDAAASAVNPVKAHKPPRPPKPPKPPKAAAASEPVR